MRLSAVFIYWAVRQRFARLHALVALLVLASLALATGKSRPLAACVAVAVLIPLCRGKRLPDWRVVRWLSHCGQRSYSIYLVRGIAGLRVLSLARAIDRSQPWAIAALCASALLTSLVAAELFYRLVEQPWQHRARQVSYRGQRHEVVPAE